LSTAVASSLIFSHTFSSPPGESPSLKTPAAAKQNVLVVHLKGCATRVTDLPDRAFVISASYLFRGGHRVLGKTESQAVRCELLFLKESSLASARPPIEGHCMSADKQVPRFSVVQGGKQIEEVGREPARRWMLLPAPR
jgi:hypothetical protein